MSELAVKAHIEEGLKNINTQVENAVKSINEEVEKHGKIGVENQKKLDGLKGGIEEVTARVLELEQAGTAQGDIENAVQSVGAQFTDSEVFNNFKNGNSTKASMEVQNNIQIGSDDTVAPDRATGVVGGAFRRLRILDFMGTGTTGSNSIEYTREVTFVNGAAETEEGDFSYAESDVTFELVNVPVRNIGTFIPVSKQMLEDAPLIASYINGRLIYSVEFRKDQQALVGNGLGQNLDGVFNTGNYMPIAGATSGDDQYVNIRRAKAQVSLADYTANAIILNPMDAANIDLIRETGDGQFIGSNPRLQSVASVWGLPVVESNAMTQGQFLLGAFDMACQFTNRRGVMVEVSDSDDDNFKKDLVTLKATARAAVEIYRPASLVGGALITA
ncbi:MAG: phage major capsid protein [Cellvibrionaceae bacterium]|nr:phage major capsid protein [Cellvibrionaceae bacterium]